MRDGYLAVYCGVEEKHEPTHSGVDVKGAEALGDVLQGGEGVEEVMHVKFELGFG